MVIAMTSALLRDANPGENGDAVRDGRAYSRLAMGSAKLSPVGRARDETAADGGDSVFWSSLAAFPDSIPRLTGSYS